MSRVLCLAEAHAAARQPRGKASRAAKDKPASFTILERVPLRLSAHKPVWDALRKHAARLDIIDAEHPDDTFPASVLLLDQLTAEAAAEVSSVLGERRALVLAAEKEGIDSDILGKPLDKIFEQELEWLQIRNLLAIALRANGKSKRAKRPRALLLIEC